MSLDRDALARAVASHGVVVRVVVADVRGSAPREPGAAMLVWKTGQDGSIGGGALEFDAVLEAREMLASGVPLRLVKAALGPDLGQCCGGSVNLLFERWDDLTVGRLGDRIFARPVAADAPAEPPLAVRRVLAQDRGTGVRPDPLLADGWFIEPVAPQRRPVWVWGAGHVGRAIVAVLAPHPGVAITWVDTAAERFPDKVPDGVSVLVTSEIATAVQQAPADALHLVLTYSHELDLTLCDALLHHGFAGAGLIGSRTKWARFRARLAQRGHSPATIARIRCPIGDKQLGKHPQAIAVGVAYGLLKDMAQEEAESPAQRDEGNRDDRRALDA